MNRFLLSIASQALITCSVAIVCIAAPALSLAGRSQAKVDPSVIQDISENGSASVLVVMQRQADVSAAYNITDHDERGWFVYNTLRAHAESTQADIRSDLAASGVRFRPFWIVNMLEVDADADLIADLAERPDVARIDSNSAVRWIEEPRIADLMFENVFSPEAIEWGVTNVNAPAVWAMGFTGQGIVVGDLDTGVRWSHTAIRSKYRGWDGTAADHNYNWWDAVHSGGGTCGANTTAPCDDNGHGSHTVGTILGDDGNGNQIGVAPGAKWIGCRNMDRGDGTPATYTECFQFMMAPTNGAGGSPDPTKRPHIVNNSWSCPPSEGCTSRAELETIVNNVHAAGIFVSVSAGNGGPGCSTVNAPPSIYGGSFSIGAIDSSNTLAGFSSRGPSTFYTPNVLKPNISAPGVSVRSVSGASDSGFNVLSGTSMAAPHVSGVVALLWSARPHLARDIAATRSLLEATANPNVNVSAQTCGGIASTSIPNNSFGYGRIDALAAVNAAGPMVQVGGRVVTPQGTGLRNATVVLAGANSPIRTVLTSPFGFYRLDDVPAGQSYTMTVRSKRFRFANRQIQPNESLSNVDFTGID
jgi:serine protease AprX